MVAIIHKRSWRDFDWILALLAIAIVAFGTIQIRYAQPTETYWIKQLIGLSIGLVAMLSIAFTDYRRLLNWAPAFYIFGLMLLIIVLIPGVGLKINGQRAWIKIPGGIGQFQPSEFVKVTTAMMLARYFGRNRVQNLSFTEMIVGGLILALPCGLIMLEPDVGSVLTYIPILAVVLFLSAIRLRLVIAAVALAVVMVPVSYWVGVKTNLIKNYQQERINVILDPENADRRRIGYHTWQSILTVGEGGLTGARGSEYSQSSLKFLPEPHTDFIFSVTAETTGFIGCLLLLACTAALVSACANTGGAPAQPKPPQLVVFMAIDGLGYLTISFATFLAPVFAAHLQPILPFGTALLGEGSLMLWLVVRGVNAGRWEAQAAAHAT